MRTFDPAASTVDLDPMVAAALAWHRREFPPVEVEMFDLTSARPVRGTTLSEITVASFGAETAAPAAGFAPTAPNATSIADASVR